MVAILEKRSLRDFDWLVALIAVSIVCFGVWQIYNAQPLENYWEKQIIGLFIALIALLTIAMTDYRRVVDAAPIFYGIGLFLLVIVLVPGIGMKINGQRCWIKLPLIGQFQPSEFVKIPVVLMLAKYYGARKGNALTIKEFFIGVAILAAPLFLIMLEPDTGQSITYFPLLAVVMFLSSIKIRYVVLSIVAVAIMMPVGYWVGVRPGS